MTALTAEPESYDRSEGEIDLFSGTWRCTRHRVTLRAGQECQRCDHENLRILHRRALALTG
jgi:hypothetical protein